MLVVMQEGASEVQIQTVIDRMVDLGFTVHRSSGVVHTVLGGVGPKDDLDCADFEVLDGVKECHRIMSPYKLVSRSFRPQGTVVRIGDVAIGGDLGGDDGGPLQRGEPGPDPALGRTGSRGGRTGAPGRRLQTAQFSL
jgi:3-deoxy-7-phosphoheptulonate synthase